MKQKIYKYEVWLMGDDKREEPSYEITEEEGQKLMMLLAGGNCNKFIIIQNDKMINTASICRLVKCPSYLSGMHKIKVLDGEKIKEIEVDGSYEEERELFKSEAETQEKFNKFLVRNKDLKLLN